jgi:hypothetical protein
MTWSEGKIARAIALQTLARKCVVLVDRCNWTGHECDVLAVTTDLRIIDVEIKISRADLKADARKDKWWHRTGWAWNQPRPAPTPRAWPPKVWKHYYTLPRDIWDDALFDALPSRQSGVLLVSEQGTSAAAPVVVSCLRRATPNKDATKLTPAQAVDIARLANLRMWDAYHRGGALEVQPMEVRDGAL